MFGKYGSDNTEGIIPVKGQTTFFYVRLREEKVPKHSAKYLARMLGERFIPEGVHAEGTPENAVNDIIGTMHALTEIHHEHVWLTNTPRYVRAQLAQTLGDYTLAMTGVFAERFHERKARRGAPDILFYEQIGASHYAQAAEDVTDMRLRKVLEGLSEDFHTARVAIGRGLSTNPLRVSDAALEQRLIDASKEYGFGVPEFF